MNDDTVLLAAFLDEALPKIERLVTRALEAGRSIGELAVDLERGIDGKVRGGCAPRGAVVRRWQSNADVAATKKTEIASYIRETSATDVPVVLSIALEGRVIFTVVRLEGDEVKPAKPS